MKSSLMLIALFILTMDSFAQVQQEWVRRYDSQHNFWGDWSYGIALDSFGNIFVTGLIGSQTSHDIGTIKYNQSGEMIWLRNYGGSSELQDFGYDIAIDLYQNIYVVGHSYDTARKDFVVLKYDNNGNFLWESRDSGNGLFLKIDSENNVIACGNFGNKTRIKKISSTGAVIWVQTFLPQNAFNCSVNDISLSHNGEIILGCIAEFPVTKDDYLILKVKPNGVVDWYKAINGSTNYDDYLSKIKINDNNDIIITGYVQNENTKDFYTIKLNSKGDSIWSNYFNSGSLVNDFAYTLDVDYSGNIYVAGMSSDQKNLVVKYDNNGIQLWNKDFTPLNGYYIFRQSVVKNNSIYLTGSYSSNLGDCAVIKVDTSWIVNWVQLYNGVVNAADWTTDIVIDKFDNVYTTGTSKGIKEDYVTIKYSQPIGIQPISSEIPSHFSLHQNYPNPFNPSTKIKFDIPLNVETTRWVVSLRIFDILGREVRTLVNENLKPGIYEAEFNAAELPSGVYFYKLQAGEFVDTKKMILLK